MFGEITKDPVCGLNVDESKAKAAGFQGTYKNETYYFCSAGCKEHFEKNPARYAAKPGEIQPTASGAAGDQGQAAQAVRTKDPVCGHEVDETQAKAAGLTSIYKGKTYYFCSYSCNQQFDKDPDGSLRQEAQGGSGGSQAPVVAKTVQDPVCSLPVATGPAKQAGRTSEYQGKLYYFDTDGCKQRFDKDPQHYLTGSSEATSTQAYPQVPTSPDLLLRLRRDSLRALPPGKGLAPFADPPPESQVKPAVPPTPPLQPPAQPAAPPQPQTPPPAPSAAPPPQAATNAPAPLLQATPAVPSPSAQAPPLSQAQPLQATPAPPPAAAPVCPDHAGHQHD
jgi:YHS domain-containing protein